MELSPDIPHIRRFDLFEVNLRSGELCQPGSKIRLQDQPLQILALLLEHPGEVVTREQLRNQLWPDGVIVDYDHSINTAIKRLRKVLDDHVEHPRYIETLPRHGYRFIATVDSGAAVRDRRERRRWLAVAAVAAIALLGALVALNVGGLRGRLAAAVGAGHGAPFPKIRSIAVLPLENLSGDPQQEYYADGMTEELITDLGNISALRVISRTSVMRYKGTRKPLPQIARELHVDAVLEGAVLLSGDRVRITANLLYAPTDRHLWAQSYERDLGDVLVLQSEVARAISSQIRVRVTSQEQARLAASRPVNAEAYRLYLQGRYYFFKRTIPGFHKSIQLFRQALEKDPKSALAYAGLSGSYAILPIYDRVTLPREVFPKAEATARRSLELDGTLAEARGALGYVLLYYDWDWSAAERELKRAIELKPSYAVAHLFYADYLTAMGRHDQAIAEIRRAQEFDPASPLMLAIGGQTYTYARRYDEAIEQCRKALELEPNFGLAHRELAWTYSQEEMFEEALAEYEEADRLMGRDSAWDRAYISALAGRRAEALKLLSRLSQQYKRREILPLDLASLYAALGEKQTALDMLEKAYENRDPYMVHLNVEQWFDPLRSEPRFQDLVRRMNFPH